MLEENELIERKVKDGRLVELTIADVEIALKYKVIDPLITSKDSLKILCQRLVEFGYLRARENDNYPKNAIKNAIDKVFEECDKMCERLGLPLKTPPQQIIDKIEQRNQEK
ncbi:MAG: hypothetical protein HWD61_06730 [Parachlamydiaceae bacterium]|nr:MAG: hypothetical protein HWD61_06730 [Parachlamydiaceae bacterium]